MPELAMFEDDLTHASYEVEVCDRYSGFAIVKQGERVFQAPLNRLTPSSTTSLSLPPSSSPSSSEPFLPSDSGIDSAATATVDVETQQVIMPDLNINLADAKAVSRALAGIGNTYARRIVERRDEGGFYRNWQDLEDRNKDVSVDWASVRQDTPYVVIF
jgi:DNA uptake protein ComE-like DNA-binding protein